MDEKIMNDLVEIIRAHSHAIQAKKRASALEQRYNIIRKEFKEKYGASVMSAVEILMGRIYDNAREELKENDRT